MLASCFKCTLICLGFVQEAEGTIVTAPGQITIVSPNDMTHAHREAQNLKTRTSGQYYGRFTGEYRA